MSNSYFRFKQFKVEQSDCAMKVGTDGVLLGAWCDTDNVKNVIDIGTGTGLITLMIAQRTIDSEITAIEIDTKASMQAQKNFEDSPWNNRLYIENTTIQEYSSRTSKKFDLVVSNPPYFVGSLQCSESRRTMARHTDTLPYSDLIQCSDSLLSENGRLSVITDINGHNILTQIAVNYGLYLSRKTEVVPKIGSEAKRILAEFTKKKCDVITTTLTIEREERHQYTEEFKSLTEPFYLDK